MFRQRLLRQKHIAHRTGSRDAEGSANTLREKTDAGGVHAEFEYIA